MKGYGEIMKLTKEMLGTTLVGFELDGTISETDIIEKLIEMDYKQYLKTKYWKNVRKVMLEIIGKECEVCGDKKGIHIHHFNYHNRGQETFNDLACLCEQCHFALHNSENGIINNISNRVAFEEKIKKINKVKSGFTNKRLVALLPFVMKSCWRIEELAMFLDCNIEELDEKFQQEFKDKLIVKSTIFNEKNKIELYTLDSFALHIIRLDFPILK